MDIIKKAIQLFRSLFRKPDPPPRILELKAPNPAELLNPRDLTRSILDDALIRIGQLDLPHICRPAHACRDERDYLEKLVAKEMTRLSDADLLKIMMERMQ